MMGASKDGTSKILSLSSILQLTTISLRGSEVNPIHMLFKSLMGKNYIAWS